MQIHGVIKNTHKVKQIRGVPKLRTKYTLSSYQVFPNFTPNVHILRTKWKVKD